MKQRARILVAAAALMSTACGGPSATRNARPEQPAIRAGEASEAAPASADVCEELAQQCHAHHKASPLVAECHLLGHDGDAAACETRREECLSACRAAAQAHSHSD